MQNRKNSRLNENLNGGGDEIWTEALEVTEFASHCIASARFPTPRLCVVYQGALTLS